MELLDIYDIDRNKTNKRIQRGDVLLEGSYHLVVHVCIFNPNGKMLIQQRHSSKIGWPNIWDITVGGCATIGENSRTAAARELKEELGIVKDFTDIRPHLTINFKFGFDDFYLIDQNLNIDELRLHPDEVQNVKWASMKDIIALIENEEFIPYHIGLIHLLFDIHNRYGSLQYWTKS